MVFLFVLSRTRPRSVDLLGGFSEAGVQVDLSLEQSDAAPCVLAARYTPLFEHFHLYDKDLPPDGVNGVGRPTRLDISSGLVATGELTADATTSDFKTEGVDGVLPVYPDSPITLHLPVSVAGDGHARVIISYMACSAFTCLPPATKTLEVYVNRCEVH
jgi:hypothetical protein